MVSSSTIQRKPQTTDYLRLARFDHVTKQVFILPGVVLAIALRGAPDAGFLWHACLGFTCAVMVASANYVINEWLDREFDKHHPTKSARVAVSVDLNPAVVYALWLGFLALGLSAAALSSSAMLLVGLLFALQGLVYNVPPMRSKDKAFVDVLSEAINNPFRLIIGWAIVDAGTLPPGSVIAAFWFGGAFLMAAKRLSEYRDIAASHGAAVLSKYRKAFESYTEANLMASCFAYALLTMALFSVFMVKYRIEYVLLIPVLTALFSVYLVLALRVGSAAQAPEKLFQEKGLMYTVVACVLAGAILTVVDIPILHVLVDQRFITISP